MNDQNELHADARAGDIAWADQFLSWFPSLGIPMSEQELKLGGFEYFQFSSLFSGAGNRMCGGFGSHQSRKVAALKCSAETIERREMLEYFASGQSAIPTSLQTSNGWAVQSSLVAAQEKAFAEALERHLLLKSFLTDAWGGFNYIQKMVSSEVEIHLLTSRFMHKGQVGCLSVAKSKSFPGASFGYGIGNIIDIEKSDFWLSAIYEATSKLLVTPVPNQAPLTDNWIRGEIDYFLESPFDISVLPKDKIPSYTDCEIGDVSFVNFDLSEKYSLDFPLFACFATGSNVIPLFFKQSLDDSDYEYLNPILHRNEIFDIPQRHPIL